MLYRLTFFAQADLDIQQHKKHVNKAVIKKLFSLFQEMYEHPFTGTGKPEALKHQLLGAWSHRINKEHRLVYRVEAQTVFILSAFGHYD